MKNPKYDIESQKDYDAIVYITEKVIGKTHPIADSYYDEKISKNIQLLGMFAGYLVDKLIEIEEANKNSQYASVSECGMMAEVWLNYIESEIEGRKGDD